MSTQHSALILPAAGAAFEVGKRDTPTAGPGQVLIRNKAVALNPVDLFIQATGYIVSIFGFPAVAGMDGAGEIAVLGEGVTGWNVGDKVIYQAAYMADTDSFQELTLAFASRIARIPSNLSYEKAVTVPLGLATAAVGGYKPRLSDLRPDGHDVGGAGLTPPWEAGGRGKYAGQVAVILGGASSVGQFAIQLAKLSGFSTIISTASKRNEAYVKSAGATHVIDYHDIPYAELSAAVKKITGDAPIKYVYDAVSTADTQKAGWDLVSSGGVLVVVLPPSPDVGKPGQEDEAGRRLVWVASVLGDPYNAEFGDGLYAVLTDLLEKGEIKPNNVEVIGHGLEVIPAGLGKLAKGVSGVKLVATL
ncbi:unnamed protein product [Peniophora sp. CBMAI 1063]|nr:unnamed protein product [Peniophora sp. CBMAI 1063]